jgi:phosphomannomutase/phosphoglucomutase
VALFKKSVTKDEEDTPQASEAKESTKPVKPQAPKGNLIGMVLVLCLLTAGAVLVSAMVQLMASNEANRSHWQELQSALGQSYLHQLNDGLGLLQRMTDQVALREDLLQVIQLGDPEVISSSEQSLQKVLADSVKVRIQRLGRAQLDSKSEIPLMFAGLDMIKRLESGQNVPLEVHRLNKAFFVEAVTAIKNPDGEIVGTLFVTYHISALFNRFALIDTALGELSIQQRFSANAQPQLLFANGQGNSSVEAYSEVSLLPHIQLSFSLSNGIVQKPLISTVQTAIANGLALILILIAIAIFYVMLNQKMNRNMHMLSEFALSLTSGRNPKLPEFSLGQFATLAQALYQQTKRNGPDVVKRMMPGTPDMIDNGGAEAEEDSVHLDLELDDDPTMTDYAQPELSHISRQIFRAYDIRGKVGDQLTEDVVELIGQAIGSEAYERGQQTIYVGHDGRLSSPDLATALVNGLQATGRDVIDIGQVTTPMLYFAAMTQAGNSGVMVTGSHNPPEYNGIKMMIDGETFQEDDISRLYERITDNDLLSGEGSYQNQNFEREYMDRITSDIAVAQPLKVVIDAGNGIAGRFAPELIESIGCDVIAMNCEVDGTFPNHHPDPTVDKNIDDLCQKVKSENADLGIAFDGDGDRLVVIDDLGQPVQPDQLIMMFAKDVLSRCPGTDIVYDVKCSTNLGNFIAQYGGRPVMWRTGHSMIKNKMLELGATLGGEMSGHIVFNERWYGFDDGLYAAARLIELLSADHRPVSEVFKGFTVGVLTPEYHIPVDEEDKFEIVAHIKEKLSLPTATITEIDGVRVDFDNGWGLVRASNTTPSLTLRFEGEDEDALSLVKSQFKEAIQSVDSSLQIPF